MSERIDGRKMYERVKVGRITVEGKVIDETFEWMPMNPQPCCDNCKHRMRCLSRESISNYFCWWWDGGGPLD